MAMNWQKLLSAQRFKQIGDEVVPTKTPSSDEGVDALRTDFHIDYDRVVFSGGFRRLGRKTQVHPFAENDLTHNRLTHSVEVASVGRSIGNRVGAMLKGNGFLPANNSANNLVKLSSTKAYLSLAGLGLIYIFNPETMQKTGEINLTSLGIQDNNPDIGIMIERDGYVFAGLSQMVGGWTSPENYKQADVAVIDTKTDKLVKMISEKTSGFSQATRPIDPKSLFMDEKGDIYISCLGNFGMVAGHKAGILRIKKGETDFDPTYHWTITGASIEGEEKVAGFAASICYAANGKAYGYIDIPGYYKPGETGHGAIASRAVVFDLYNQKMKKIEGLDLSNGYGVLVSKYKDGLAIANASTTTKGIYYLNPQTDKINPIPMITTIGNPMAIEWFGN